MNIAIFRTAAKPLLDRFFDRRPTLRMDAKLRDACKLRLAAEGLKSWGTLRLRATGMSMLPTLWPGDALAIESCAAGEVEPGEIVLFMRDDRFFIHRLLSKQLGTYEICLLTRGDCMSDYDPPVSNDEFLGRVKTVQRPGRAFTPGRNRSLGNRFLAFLFCHSNLSRGIALRIREYRNSNENETTRSLTRTAEFGSMCENNLMPSVGVAQE